MTSSGNGSSINENSIHNLSESDLARTFYAIVRTLCEKRLVSRDPQSIRIERFDRNAVPPCGRSYGVDPLDTSQLEWAAQKGRFWFGGRVKSLKVALDKRPIQGCLELEPNRMTFTTHLNLLNVENFEAAHQRMKKSSEQLGLGVHFEQPWGLYNVWLIITENKTLTLQNAIEFLDKIDKI